MNMKASREAASCAATQEFPTISWNIGLLLCPQEHSTGLYPESDQTSPYHPILISLRSFLILYTHPLHGLPSLYIYIV
jgi:hypothetical protein